MSAPESPMTIRDLAYAALADLPDSYTCWWHRLDPVRVRNLRSGLDRGVLDPHWVLSALASRRMLRPIAGTS